MKKNYTSREAIKQWLIGMLTTLSLSSATALAAQPSEKQITAPQASCGCLKAVLAAGYTLEDDDSCVNQQMGQTSPSMTDPDNRDDKDDRADSETKDDKSDKDRKDDTNDKDHTNDTDRKDDNDDGNISSPAKGARPALSGLLVYEVKKNGMDYDIYVDPKNCQIRAAIRDK